MTKKLNRIMDITMCLGKNCLIKLKCLRFTAKANEFRQSFFIMPPYDKKENKCEYFLKKNK